MLSMMLTPGDAGRVCCGFVQMGSSATNLILEWRNNGICEGGRQRVDNSNCM